LLAPELLELSLLAFDLGLLLRKLPLHRRVLILALLHLVADQGAAEEPDGSADTRTGACIARRATDNRP